MFLTQTASIGTKGTILTPGLEHALFVIFDLISQCQLALKELSLHA